MVTLHVSFSNPECKGSCVSFLGCSYESCIGWFIHSFNVYAMKTNRHWWYIVITAITGEFQKSVGTPKRDTQFSLGKFSRGSDEETEIWRRTGPSWGKEMGSCVTCVYNREYRKNMSLEEALRSLVWLKHTPWHETWESCSWRCGQGLSWALEWFVEEQDTLRILL